MRRAARRAMPPKKEPPAAKGPSADEKMEAAKELTETELLLSFLRSKLGRCARPGVLLVAARGTRVGGDLG